jgi:prepilin-type N-terminal cleavage/methylation domain-containing protein
MKNINHKSGFSLIEVLIAIVLVGLAIASLVAANGAFTRANGVGVDLSTAEFLLEQMKELTAMMPVVDPNGATPFGPETGETVAYFDDLGDFDNATFSPPIDTRKNPLNNFTTFSQQVIVENVNPSDFDVVISDYGSDFVRVTVKVFQNSTEIISSCWLRTVY